MKPIGSVILACLLFTWCFSATVFAQSFDLVLTNGHIIDGTGSPWYSGDLGIREGKIAAIGNLANAPRKRTIDVQGHTVRIGVQSERLAMMNQMIPLGRGGTPQEAAGAVYLFCSPDSDYVSGQTLLVTGGL